MQIMQQLSMDKPGSLKPLGGHVAKHKGKTMVDCFPDWTEEALELRRNGSAGESKEEVAVFDEFTAETAIKAMTKEKRQEAIATAGGKPVWSTLSWMQRYEILVPKKVEYKADKEIKGKKKASHKRH